MTPLYFGPADTPRFGWLHAGAAAPRLAVLLCAPLGHEDLAAHAGLRQLAEALSDAGLPVLRFDLAGCGDSADPSGEGELPAHWLHCIGLAADTVRARSGAPRIAIVGLRMGALLAAHAALARDDVAALLALLPVASGRAWLRECKLLAGAAAAEAGAPTELGGLVLDAAAEAAVSALRWPQPGGRPLKLPALLLEREDLTPAAGVAEALGALGATVHREAWAGLDRVTAIAHAAHLPAAVVARMRDWLVAQAACLPAPAAAVVPAPGAVSQAELRHGAVPIVERAVGLGSAPRLVGVLSQRRDPLPGARQGLVLLSSGAERRVGPNRLWVAFARERAAAGDVVLRLDLAGLGDSAAREAGAEPDVYDPRSVADIATAVAWLRAECGVQACHLVGVCSGAYHAWRAALQGESVNTVVAVNPLVFHWKPGMSLDPLALDFGQIAIAASAGRSLRDPQRWLKLLQGRVNLRVIATALLGRARQGLQRWGRGAARTVGLPLKDDLAAELTKVTRRGVRPCFVFAEGDPGLALLRSGAGRALARLTARQLVELRTIARADHTFTRQGARAALYEALNPLLDRPAGVLQ